MKNRKSKGTIQEVMGCAGKKQKKKEEARGDRKVTLKRWKEVERQLREDDRNELRGHQMKMRWRRAKEMERDDIKAASQEYG